MRLTSDSNRDAEEEDAVCWVCCENCAILLPTGCACRGSGGFAHVGCVVQVARHHVDRWTSCPTCLQDFTGAFEVGMARARWELVCNRPAEDAERLFVANNLAVTLQESAGDFQGALLLLEEVLAVRRETLGNEHADTLDSITNLALHHTETGNYADALKLSEEVVAARRARSNQDDEYERAHSIGSLAAVHNLMGNFHSAQPLHEEALHTRQRLLGHEHLDTLNSKHGLGQCLVGLGRHEEGLALLQLVVASAERLLGDKHPTSIHFSNGLAAAKHRVRELTPNADL